MWIVWEGHSLTGQHLVLSRQPLKEAQWIKEILQKRKAPDSARTIEELTSGSHL